MLCCAYRLRRRTSRKSIGNQLEVDGESVVMSNGENTAEDRKLPPRHPRMYLIRRMLFHANETYKNTLAFELFRKRYEIGGPGLHSVLYLTFNSQTKDAGPPTSKRTRNSSNAVVAFKCFLIRKRHSPDQLRPEETIF